LPTGPQIKKTLLYLYMFFSLYFHFITNLLEEKKVVYGVMVCVL